MRKTELILRGLPPVVAALPFVPTLVALASRPWPATAFQSDPASLELYVRQVARGEALVGPYSRFGWNHPGPAEFLALLPLYALTGGRSASLALGTALLNLGAALGCVVLLSRRAGASAAWGAAALVAVFAAFLGPARLADPWNPYVTILPCALVLCLAASCAANGPARALPALAAVATFLVQSHVAYVPVVGVTLVAAACLRLSRRPLEPISGRALGGAAVILLLLWAPPLLEQLGGVPGNLSRLAAFFARTERSHPFAEAFGAAAGPLGGPSLALATLVVPSTTDERGVGCGFATLALVATLPLAAARSRERPFVRALAGLSAAALGVAIWSLLQIRGPILDYLVLWISALGLAGWIAVLAALLPGDRPRLRAAAVGTVAVGLGLLAARSAFRRLPGELPMGLTRDRDVEAIVTASERWLDREHVTRPLLRIGSHDTWPLALGVALALEKAGVHVSVDPEWVVMFGPSLTASGREDAALVLGDVALAAAYADRPDAEEVARHGSIVLLGLRDLGYESSALLRGASTVRVHGARGDPSRLSTGRFPREGSRWDSNDALVLSGPEDWVEVEMPSRAIVAGLLVSADDNDTYTVAASRDGTSFEEIGVLPRASGGGLRRRAFYSRRLAGCRAVRLSPREGDGSYSIGAVGFLAAPDVTSRSSPP